ncbi:hypothetical protein [Nocardiopsis alborubida]|uniref:Uncharacterized protein n=1 Tax=Nocardiopsis alborubida TaxID=146802 RepID=A0A7X6RP06_9ACTN|nr:hypothetical protein [Nocardiopsis alborubida]NKY97330.1 hypothetical protein [Nocardiopsis alborubida]
MLQFSAALISRALGPLIALFSSPCGRHSTVVGRRRRSTRVRRYAPSPPAAPVQVSRSRASRRETPENPAPPARPNVPAPCLTPPSEQLNADEVALVRPYFTAHESLRAAETRVPAPRTPAARKPVPSGLGPGLRLGSNLGETETEEVRRAFAQARIRAAAIVRQWREDPGGDLLGGPAPRFGVVGPVIGPVVGPPEPRTAPPGEWDELTSRIRALLHQRQGATA